VELADALKELVPEGLTLADLAQRWILDQDAVSTVITGASRPEQVLANARVSKLAPLDDELHKQFSRFYKARVDEHIRGPY